jgi:hypothetical protein
MRQRRRTDSEVNLALLHLKVILPLNENIQNYKFSCGSVWVWYLVSDIKGGT